MIFSLSTLVPLDPTSVSLLPYWIAKPSRSLSFNFVSKPIVKAWPSVSLDDEFVLSPIFVTLMDPSDQLDQLSGMIDLSFLASSWFVNDVRIALPKSNLILFLLKLSLSLFCFK